jgi:DNA-binding response OmpR family regulator
MGRLCPPAGRKTVRGPFRPGIFRRDDALFGVFYASKPLARFLICKLAMNSILVIDDTEDIRNLVATVLTNYGFTVREAPNGQRGVQMIAEEKPDLVICDVNMPAMSGYETLAAVRESSQTATIPFILMTGMDSRDGFRRGMVCGADDYLVKPFTADELIEAVMSRLERQSELQLEADKRAQQLHEYAAHYAFPELAGSIDDTIGSAVA